MASIIQGEPPFYLPIAWQETSCGMHAYSVENSNFLIEARRHVRHYDSIMATINSEVDAIVRQSKLHYHMQSLFESNHEIKLLELQTRGDSLMVRFSTARSRSSPLETLFPSIGCRNLPLAPHCQRGLGGGQWAES